MEFDHLDSILEQQGLSERQRLVYLELLKKGGRRAANIQVGLQRANVYAALKELQEKGLVFETTRDNITIFSSDNMKNLAIISDDVADRSRRNAEIISELRERIKQSDSPEAIFPSIMQYKGIEGLRVAYMNLLESAAEEEIVALVPQQFDFSKLAELGEWFIQKRIERNIKLLCIEPVESLEAVRALDNLLTRETRCMPLEIASGECLVEASKTILILGYVVKEEVYTIMIKHAGLSGIVYKMLRYVWSKGR